MGANARRDGHRAPSDSTQLTRVTHSLSPVSPLSLSNMSASLPDSSSLVSTATFGYTKSEIDTLRARLAFPSFEDGAEVVPDTLDSSEQHGSMGDYIVDPSHLTNQSSVKIPLAEYSAYLKHAYSFLAEDVHRSSGSVGSTLTDLQEHMPFTVWKGTRIDATDMEPLLPRAKSHIMRPEAFPEEELLNLLLLDDASLAGRDAARSDIKAALVIFAHMYTNLMLKMTPPDHRPSWLGDQAWAELYSQFPIGLEPTQDPAKEAQVDDSWLKMGEAFATTLAKRSPGHTSLHKGKTHSPATPSRAQLDSLQSTLETFSTATSKAAIPGALAVLMDKHADVTSKQFFAFAVKASATTKPEAMLVSDENGTSAVVRAVHKAPSKSITRRSDMFKAFEMMVRAFAYGDAAFGLRWGSDARDVLGQVSDMLPLDGVVQYMDQLLLSVFGHARRQVKAFKRAFPTASMPTSWPFETTDLTLNMQLVQVISARAAVHTSSDDAHSPPTKSKGSPKKHPKPPQHQLDCNGKRSNPVNGRAREMSTSAKTRSQSCIKFSEGQACAFFDTKSNKCPFSHGSQTTVTDKAKKRKRKGTQKTKKKKKSSRRGSTSHSDGSRSDDSSN